MLDFHLMNVEIIGP